jgi:hypothetical protein
MATGEMIDGLLAIPPQFGRMVVDDLEAMIAGLPPLAMQVAQPEIVYRLD